MTRRYEYPVTVRVDPVGDGDPLRPEYVRVAIAAAVAFDGLNVEVTVGEPVDITPKSAADRAAEVILSFEDDIGMANVHRIAYAVRAAVGEDTP